MWPLKKKKKKKKKKKNHEKILSITNYLIFTNQNDNEIPPHTGQNGNN